jgi:uncharacterized protein YehS (DUF1456 family)
MENNNINLLKMRIDLSAIPEDIIPIIAKYLLKVDNTYKFNKIFRKRNDNKLLNISLVMMKIYLDTLIISLVMIIKLNVKRLIFNL